MYTYNAYGLLVASQLQLNGLNIDTREVPPDIYIKFGMTPATLTSPIVNNPHQQINTTEFLLNIKGLARFYVNSGKDIIIQKADDVYEGDIQVFLMGTIFAYVLQYHNYLVLHGSAILVNGQAVIFSGDSGAGKSTIAAAFAKKGYNVFTDDMVVIKYTDDNKFELIQGWPRLKLWQDALSYFGEKSDNLIRVQNKQNKYEFPIKVSQEKSVPILAFYELNPCDDTKIILNSISSGLDCLDILVKNTFRYYMLKGLKKYNLHLKQCSILAKNIAIRIVQRPKIGYRLDELVQVIEKDVYLITNF
jgi:hypothetical protein